jgi:transmembrane protein EpsG
VLTYGLLFVFVLTCGFFARDDNGSRHPRLLGALAIMAGLVLVLGLRNGPGTDFRAYEFWYLYRLPDEAIADGKDPGFTALCHAILAVFGSEPVWMFFVSAVLTCVPIVWTLRRYARPFELGVAIYFLAGAYAFSFNGVRQAIAAAIVFAGSRFLFERRWRPFFAIVAVASFFHSTALVWLPIYWLVTVRAGPLVNSVMITGASAFVLLNRQLAPLLTDMAGEGRWDVYRDALVQDGEGAHWLRILVRIVICAFAVIRRRQLEMLMPGVGSILVRLSFVSVLLFAISSVHWIYARFAFYPAMYEMLVIPLIVLSYRRDSRAAMYVGILGAFMAYGALLALAGESRLLPYESVFG